jgi:hypothetical protein
MAKRKQVTFFIWGYALLVFLSGCMYATAVNAMSLTPDTAPQAVPIFDLLAVLVGSESAAQWITVVGFAAWVLTQLMAWLPTQWVAKLPTWVIKLLKVLAGNYRKASNEITNDPEQIRRSTQSAS